MAKKMRTQLKVGIVVALATLLAALPALAAGVGEAEVGGSLVSFLAAKRTTLKIVGPGSFELTVDLKKGERFGFSPFNADGENLEAGVYGWEMVARTPRVQTNKAMDDGGRGLAGISAKAAAQGRLSSGVFTLGADGSFAASDLDEPVAERPRVAVSDKGAAVPTKDQVILDDLIVDGSICVGLDCVNGESFGFDTIRLKENNLRIRFVDTSSTASFPSRDWQITANDSANGGLNKFSIDDIDGGRTPFTIEGNAPTNSLYVDDGGRLGLGTSIPVVDVHIKTGNTPTLRLEQDGSSGFASQTWDVAGNEANYFIRDVTNGSTLPFRIRPGAPTSAIDVAASGNVGIGTASPDQRLHVNATGDTQVHIQGTSGFTGFVLENTSATAADSWVVSHGNGGAFAINDTDAVDGAGGGQEFRIFNDGDVTISGALTTSGATCAVTPCDGVFKPEYELESIEDHAAYMWEESHLKGVGPTAADAPLNISQKVTGILNELEKAHIYIEQLHKTIQELQTKDQIVDLQQRLMTLEELLADR